MPLLLLLLGLGAVAFAMSERRSKVPSSQASRAWQLLLQGTSPVANKEDSIRQALMQMGVPVSSVLDAVVSNPSPGSSVLQLAFTSPVAMEMLGRTLTIDGASYTVSSVQPIPIDISAALNRLGR